MSFAGIETITITANRLNGTIRPKRSIGGMVADVTVEEVHDDAVEITQHPVEKTADITDHAYPLPPRLRVTIGYSPSGSSQGGLEALNPFGGDPVPLQTIYDQYLAKKDARELIQVQTGKRLYDDMLIRSISLVTDKDTENALFLVIDLQHLILVETQTVEVPQNSVQKEPQITGNKLQGGTKNATPSPSSFNATGAQSLVNQPIAA